MTIITDTLLELDNEINAADSIAARLRLLEDKEKLTQLAIASTGQVEFATATSANISGTISAPGEGLAIYINRYTCSYKNEFFGIELDRHFQLTCNGDVISEVHFIDKVKTVEVGVLCPANAPVNYSLPHASDYPVLSSVSIVYTILSANPSFTTLDRSVVY